VGFSHGSRQMKSSLHGLEGKPNNKKGERPLGKGGGLPSRTSMS